MNTANFLLTKIFQKLPWNVNPRMTHFILDVGPFLSLMTPYQIQTGKPDNVVAHVTCRSPAGHLLGCLAFRWISKCGTYLNQKGYVNFMCDWYHLTLTSQNRIIYHMEKFVLIFDGMPCSLLQGFSSTRIFEIFWLMDKNLNDCCSCLSKWVTGLHGLLM